MLFNQFFSVIISDHDAADDSLYSFSFEVCPCSSQFDAGCIQVDGRCAAKLEFPLHGFVGCLFGFQADLCGVQFLARGMVVQLRLGFFARDAVSCFFEQTLLTT